MASTRYAAGDSAIDLCSFCGVDRPHEVSIADGDGRIVRLICDVCRSEHRYHGSQPEPEVAKPKTRAPRAAANDIERPFPLVSERERRFGRTGQANMSEGEGGEAKDLELMLRAVIREELGLTAVVPAGKWREGQLILRPGREGLQDKSWPIETFFNKIVMLRNKLRVLEQQINADDKLSEASKIKFQGYITSCYGTLTSFNVLFADPEDHFKGAGGA